MLTNCLVFDKHDLMHRLIDEINRSSINLNNNNMHQQFNTQISYSSNNPNQELLMVLIVIAILMAK